MGFIKKQVYPKRLYLHIDTVLTKNLRMESIMKKGILLTVALESVDSS